MPMPCTTVLRLPNDYDDDDQEVTGALCHSFDSAGSNDSRGGALRIIVTLNAKATSSGK